MKLCVSLCILLSISLSSFAQQGINYKAIIKDTNGNVLASEFMNVQFTIHETSAAGTIVYQEDYNYTTDANGIIILNIGSDPTPSIGVFEDINWSADLHFLQMTITCSEGTINFDPIEFMAVPYAKHATNALFAETSGDTKWIEGTTANDITNNNTGKVEIASELQLQSSASIDEFSVDGTFADNSDTALPTEQAVKTYVDSNLATGLEQITELNSTTGVIANGWRLKGFNLDYYGPIGLSAVDLSFSNVESTTYGALGRSSFAGGEYVTASGSNSVAMGRLNTAIGANSVAMGRSNIASGDDSVAIGASNTASNDYSVALGRNSTASGNTSIAMGDVSKAIGNYSVAIGNGNEAIGFSSTALGSGSEALATRSIAIGYFAKAYSFGEIAMGYRSTSYTPLGVTEWNDNDRLFVIGNTSPTSSFRDALIILKDGTITAPSLFNFRIENANNKVLITKDYVEDNYINNSSNMLPLAYGTVESNGNIRTGTDNFIAIVNGGVFTIDVNETESLSYDNTVCLITPISTAPRTSSTIIANGNPGNGDTDNDLIVRIFNTSGSLVATTFQFVIYKL